MEEDLDNKKSIESTKKGFENSFAEGNLYDRQTQDAGHLLQIINSLELAPGCKVLDLGTGTGYVAFEIAKRYKLVQVIGLDIVEKTLEKNVEKAKEEHLSNIKFMSYDGMNFPFDSNTFDIVVSRYALHHFPNIEKTFTEISRILKPGGQLLISDPTPNDNDISGLVDDYMRMKPDGHIKYYTKSEWKLLGELVGLELTDSYETVITFPRLKATAIGFNEILKNHSDEIIKDYSVYETDDGKYIFITQRVWNISFVKIGS